MSNKIALLLAVQVAIAACKQVQPPHNRIIGEDEINISYVPYQVSLQCFDRHCCGGSVLNKKWILTAAQCTKRAPVSHLKIRVGSSEHASGGTVVQIKRIVEHPLHSNKTFDYDFSLMELETELTFSDVIKPVTLPGKDDSFKDGTMAAVSGWGDTRNVNESSAILRAVNTPIMSQDDCRKAYDMFKVTDRMLCAAYPQGGKNACNRDSGGPLIADGKLVGVVSWSIGCAKTGYPTVYGRVASVRNWIRNISNL